MLETWPASVIYITQDNNNDYFYVLFGTSKNTVNADRIMKFIDEHNLNCI